MTGDSSAKKARSITVAATSEPANANANQVLSVSPAQGSTVAVGTRLTFTYASGKTTVPNVASYSLDQAKSALSDAGLTNVTTSEQESTATAGSVIGTNPAAGASVTKGTRITILIAKAPATPTPDPTTNTPEPAPTTDQPETPTAAPTTGG